jgi:hypothetical protein
VGGCFPCFHRLSGASLGASFRGFRIYQIGCARDEFAGSVVGISRRISGLAETGLQFATRSSSAMDVRKACYERGQATHGSGSAP